MDRQIFLILCEQLDAASASDFSGVSRDQLLELHKALANLKTAVEEALIIGSRGGGPFN